MSDTDALMTATEVAALLQVTVEWVWDQSRRGEMPSVKLGKYRRFRRSAILEWVEQKEKRTYVRRSV